MFFGPVAQRLEQGTHNPLVVGSNPTGPTFYYKGHPPQKQAWQLFAKSTGGGTRTRTPEETGF